MKRGRRDMRRPLFIGQLSIGRFAARVDVGIDPYGCAAVIHCRFAAWVLAHGQEQGKNGKVFLIELGKV